MIVQEVAIKAKAPSTYNDKSLVIHRILYLLADKLNVIFHIGYLDK